MNKSILTFIFLTLFSLSAWADDSIDVPAIISKNKCIDCHKLSPKDSGGPDKGPDLFFSGNKFKTEWLIEFLQKPETIRIAGHITNPGFLTGQPTGIEAHPILSTKEGKAVAKYLMSLKLEGFESGKVDSFPLSKGQKVKAKILFERDYGCTACHKGINLARKPKGGISGPSLVTAGDRLNPDWIFHWLKNPKTFIDRGRMPAFKFDDETTIQIVKYLMTLKKENLR